MLSSTMSSENENLFLVLRSYHLLVKKAQSLEFFTSKFVKQKQKHFCFHSCLSRFIISLEHHHLLQNISRCDNERVCVSCAWWGRIKKKKCKYQNKKFSNWIRKEETSGSGRQSVMKMDMSLKLFREIYIKTIWSSSPYYGKIKFTSLRRYHCKL